MIETKDLVLKAGSFEDWPCMYFNLWRHWESARYMLWDVTTSEEEARARMLRTLAFEEAHPCTWLVYEKATGQAIGFAGLEMLDDEVCEETGIAIGPAFTGKGYGKQILNGLLDFAKRDLGMKRFIASYRTGNIPSMRMQLSCGFQPTRQEEREDPRTGEKYILQINEKNL